jgi:putative peptide zinc metalloprotease protein
MDLPKLRTDLVISRQERAGRVLFVIKDPLSERYFQLGEREYFIASLLDGMRGPDEVARALEGELGVTMTPEALRAFTAKLAGLGLLAGTEPVAARPARLRPRARPGERGLSRYFTITVRAFDPEGLLRAIGGKISFIFTGPFLVTALATISVALVVAVSNRTAIWDGMSNVFQFRNFMLAWMAVLSVGMIHEMAHAATCRHFGGRVREMGVLLLYFQPCLFSNVSDAWLFGRKSHRIWVTFAGGFVEMVIWAIAVLVWRVAAPETTIHHLAFIIMAASGLTVLFNFNPLIRLDGYYMLSDLLDVPNLRGKAFAYIRSLLAGWILGIRTEEKALGLREKRIYITYGLIAMAYTGGLVGYILYRLSHFMVRAYGWWALALVIVGALYAVRNPIRESVEGAAEKAEEHKEEILSKRRVRVFPIVLVVVLLALFFVPWPLKVSGDFVLLAEKRATLRAEIEGTVAKVYVKEGDRVKAGAPVISLVDVEIASELKQTDAEIAEAEARLALLKNGARPQEIQRARSEVQAAEVSLELERSNFNRIQELRRKELIPQDQYELAETTVELREQELEGARAQLALLLAGSRPEEIEEAQARLDRLRAARDLLDYRMRTSIVRSPIDGTVLTPSMDQLADAYLEYGDDICEIADKSVMEAEIFVPEKEVPDVALGKEVKAKAKGYPYKSFYGVVSSVGQKAERGDKQSYVIVRSFIDNKEGLLKPGMTGVAKIYCRRSSPLRILIRRIVRSIRAEFWW